MLTLYFKNGLFGVHLPQPSQLLGVFCVTNFLRALIFSKRLSGANLLPAVVSRSFLKATSMPRDFLGGRVQAHMPWC